jgi:hypothetical protein
MVSLLHLLKRFDTYEKRQHSLKSLVLSHSAMGVSLLLAGVYEHRLRV